MPSISCRGLRLRIDTGDSQPFKGCGDISKTMCGILLNNISNKSLNFSLSKDV